MTVCDDCFREFLHPIFHKLMDKNNQFFERYGRHVRWDWDDVAATLTFSDPVLPTVRIDVTVVGSTEIQTIKHIQSGIWRRFVNSVRKMDTINSPQHF